MTHNRLAILAFIAVLGAPPVAAQAPVPTRLSGADADLQTANVAWDRGDYVAALEAYARLLASPDAARVVEPIALTTGELFRTTELSPDGRVARISPDGRFVSYETGSGDSSALRIVSVEGGTARQVANLPWGTDAMFAPAGNRLAYLRIGDILEVEAARAQLILTRPNTPQRTAAQAAVNWLEAKHTRIIIRDLRTGVEGALDLGGVIPGARAWSPDGSTLYVVGTNEADTTRNDIFAFRFTASPCSASRGRIAGCVAPGGSTAVTTEPGYKADLEARGGVLMYELATQPAVRRPPPPGTEPAGGRGGRGGGGRGGGGRGGGGRGGGAGAPTEYAIRDLTAGTVRRISGTAASLSADGSTVVYLSRAGAATNIMVAPTRGAGEPTVAKTATVGLTAPALSPDGRQVAFQMMPREDWELYIVDADGQNERRLTREIQHDLLPRWLGAGRIFAVMGEARHRRSYLYDVATLQRTRLFHNNTVRTVAPEYEWSTSADGSKILVAADRDGNTVSAERGVYVMDLDRKVTPGEVLARVRSNLATETSLRDRGVASFRLIADSVRAVTEQVSISRIFDYQKRLYDFDSKHISRPGNELARNYLLETYRAFGYDAELQWFDQQNALGGRTANILATLRGTENPELIYIVSSHFDSQQPSPGADDNTSGTAALLEAARVLADHPQPATIIFASFTGEEAGLLGSREWVRQAVANNLEVAGALNNDMLGWSNDHRLDNTIRYSNPGIRDIQHAAAMQFSKLITYDALYYRSTDAAAYYEAYGDIVGGIGSYPILGNPHYHQSHDILEVINHELVTEVSRTTVATLMLLASSPSRLKALRVTRYASRTAELSWTPSPERGIRQYIVAYGPATDPMRTRVTVTEPRATIQNVEPGTVVQVKAVNARGLEGWDWARTSVGSR
jgi:Tol biopolymer transport system component